VNNVIELHSHSEQETREIGRLLGTTLGGGEVIELCGPLGVGKTQLAKGLATGLGVPEDVPVTSPTFVLVREYAGRLAYYHCDAYRLRSVDELLALGLEEILDAPDAVVAIEWADRFPAALTADAIRVNLTHQSHSSRRLRITRGQAAWLAELARLLTAAGLHAVDRANSRK
jgi:tRNA threonylcarbamoyladenosine biosynthesis protein TsaE